VKIIFYNIIVLGVVGGSLAGPSSKMAKWTVIPVSSWFIVTPKGMSLVMVSISLRS